MTTTTHWTDNLVRLSACPEAVEWAMGYESLGAAWATCKRGDWMLWIAGRCAGKPMSDTRRPLTLAACECARLILPHVLAGEDRPRLAIEMAERWAHGDDSVTREMLLAATAAAATAATAATAAYAAATAAAAAVDAATAAYAAAAAYAATAAATAAAAAARAATLMACADIARRHYPKPPSITP